MLQLSQKYSGNFHTIDIIQYWLNTYDCNEFKTIINDYKNFINAKKFRMTANNLSDYSKPFDV